MFKAKKCDEKIHFPSHPYGCE